MNTAIIYDRVNKWGGAERVLLTLNEIFPNAPLYTAVYSPKKAKWAKIFPNVIPTYLNKIPYLREKHELLGTFTPLAFELLDMSGYDLVISVTSEAAKGVITSPSSQHICYCLTPTRYLYSGRKLYNEKPPSYLNFPLYRYISKPFLYYVTIWDNVAASRPDNYLAISTVVKERIKRYYHRDSEIIYPPVDVEKFKVNGKVRKGNYYLLVSRLVPYKKVDLAVNAFNKLGKKLIIVGVGSEQAKLKSIAKENIEFVGEVPDTKLSEYYQKAKALIFPQEEDFGIVAVEAISSGTPVVAYKGGGVKDIVVDGVNGVYFDTQEENALVQCVKKFDTMIFNTREISKTVGKFSKERFKKEFIAYCKKNAQISN